MFDAKSHPNTEHPPKFLPNSQTKPKNCRPNVWIILVFPNCLQGLAIHVPRKGTEVAPPSLHVLPLNLWDLRTRAPTSVGGRWLSLWNEDDHGRSHRRVPQVALMETSHVPSSGGFAVKTPAALCAAPLQARPVAGVAPHGLQTTLWRRPQTCPYCAALHRIYLILKRVVCPP